MHSIAKKSYRPKQESADEFGDKPYEVGSGDEG